MNTVCISTKNSSPKKVGDKTHGVPSTSQSKGKCSPCPPTVLHPCVFCPRRWHTSNILVSLVLHHDTLWRLLTALTTVCFRIFRLVNPSRLRRRLTVVTEIVCGRNSFTLFVISAKVCFLADEFMRLTSDKFNKLW